jgi:hypothetical protein
LEAAQAEITPLTLAVKAQAIERRSHHHRRPR